VTLIGIKLARLNQKFLFLGAAPDCANCTPSLKSVCIDNLEPGSLYIIVNIRNIHHPCKIHEGGVIVVEVQKAPVTAAVESKMAFEGATISYSLKNCKQTTCSNFKYCHPVGLTKSGKYKIRKVFGALEPCMKGHHLKLVELEEQLN